MNEVTRVHLGRQAFTIAIDAHKSLQAYLAEIEDQVGKNGSDVVKEVELRMAELLSEHGVSSEKVILMEDVKFLKDQLGDPKDFKGDGDDDDTISQTASADAPATKRLFRDTKNGMVAGVAAGIANYFGIDVLLIRIVLVLTVFAGGWGILLYIALWLLIPEAKSSSEKLQMEGKAVTVDSLKQIVNRANVPAAAHRASNTIVPLINSVFRIIVKSLGIVIIFASLALLFGLINLSVYLSLHKANSSLQEFFPIGTEEHVLLILGLVFVALSSIFMIIVGLAIFKRKWPLPTWVTATILSLLFIILASGIALGVDSAPTIHQRFVAAHHQTYQSVQSFTSVNVIGERPVEIRYSTQYAVALSYIDNPDVSQIKATVTNNVLNLNTGNFARRSHCHSHTLCLFPDYDLTITVYTPLAPSINNNGKPINYGPTPPAPPKPIEVNSD
jgi:phage shock protein PspC (stress-responsive transcriptional regulator)